MYFSIINFYITIILFYFLKKLKNKYKAFIMEEEKVPSKPADARIVRTVRKLKSNVSHINNKLEENKAKDSKPDIKSLSRKNTTTELKEHKFVSSKNVNNKLNEYKQRIPINKNSNNKILLDGSVKTNDKIKVFDYETLKRYKKRQNTTFQKNLLSNDNINKYKEEFVSIIKKDKNIKSMLNKLNLIKDDNYLEYIENNFFNKPHFLFVLEMLIFDEVEQANTLKVFRTKNVVPLKVIKENYFKDEITKELQKKIYQIEYENKAEILIKNLDDFIENMKNEPLDL